MATGVLGCPETYTVRAHWRGGERLFGDISGVTSITWARRLDKTSVALIEVTKPSAAPECVSRVLSKIAEWVHEISIYRDEKLVWQGPVTSVRERRSTMSIEARDVLVYLDRRINWKLIPKQNADGTTIARGYVQAAFADYIEPGTGVRWSTDPNVLKYLTVYTGAPRAKVDRYLPRSTYFGPLLRTLSTQGMDFTCVGRRIIIMPEATAKTRAQARLTDAHFSEEAEVLSDGMAIATRATVTWTWTPNQTALAARQEWGISRSPGELPVGAGALRGVDGAQDVSEPASPYPWTTASADSGDEGVPGSPEAFLTAGKSQLGKSSRTGACAPYGAWYGEQTGESGWECAPWAFTFLSWCAQASGNTGALPEAGDGQQMAEAFQQAGRWSDDPQDGCRGAVVFFTMGGTELVNHGGIVARLRPDGRLEVVEGDTAGLVTIRVRSLDEVAGYGYPAYPSDPAPRAVLAAEDKTVAKSLSGLRRADTRIWGFIDALQVYQAEAKETAATLWRPKLTTLLTQTDPPKPMVQVPENAFLSPRAPISMQQLVPGVRIDLALDGYQRTALAGLRLSDVSVTWRPGEPERVTVAFAPLRGQEIAPDVWDES